MHQSTKHHDNVIDGCYPGMLQHLGLISIHPTTCTHYYIISGYHGNVPVIWMMSSSEQLILAHLVGSYFNTNNNIKLEMHSYWYQNVNNSVKSQYRTGFCLDIQNIMSKI